MHELILTAVSILAVSASVEVMLAAAVLIVSRQSPKRTGADEYRPEIAVILSLRGADASLAGCLESVLNQDYPHYSTYIIIDSATDPSWPVVNRIIAKYSAREVNTEYLREPRPVCSLKCASQVQVMQKLDPAVEIIVFIDADTSPHNTWLSELISHFLDKKVAAVSGMRWYKTGHRNPGSIVRHIWNAASIVQMFWLKIAWGGCLAVRRSVLSGTDMLERMHTAFGEDTLLGGLFRDYSLKLKIVPSLFLLSNEGCTLAGFIDWACRQLVSVRLHHPRWRMIVAAGIFPLTALAICLIAFIVGLVTDSAGTVVVAGSALVFYELFQTILLLIGEKRVYGIVKARDDEASDGVSLPVKYFPLMIPISQALHLFILIRAILTRVINWRGIDYKIEGPGRIKLVSYTPCTDGQGSHKDPAPGS